jgi:geranylgeranylglycerol-phosphate geranylgeranyltransferase
MIVIGRPVNNLITFVSVLTAGLLLADVPELRDLLIAAAGAGLVGGFGNAINDCRDHEIDSVNKPSRPIPSGKLTVTGGYLSAGLHLLIGLWLSYLVNTTCLLIAAAAGLLLFIYALYGKRLLVIANVTVAVVCALSFVYAAAVGGIWEWGQIKLVILGTLFVFLFHLGREIIKDIEDVIGDRAGEAKTLPITVGLSFSKAAVTVVYAILACVMIAAFFVLDLTMWYLIFASVTIFLPLADVLSRLYGSSTPDELRRVQKTLKALMPFGLAVLLIARYTV